MINIRLQRRIHANSNGGFALLLDPRRIWRASFFTVIACWLFFGSSKAFSQQAENAEYPVKLAFLYNFTKFVEWPADSYSDPGAPLLMCIVGHDPFNQELEGELRTRTVGDHPVQIRSLRPNDKLSICHIVFVPVTEKEQADRIVKGLKGSRTLTVGESEGFAVSGGIINLTVDGNKVHFEINRIAAERAGLKISSKLLSIARIVKERDSGNKI